MTVQENPTLTEILYQISRLSVSESIAFLVNQYPGKVCFSTSFSFEDQAITHVIASHDLPVSIFTLDTGRLFGETYSVWSSTLNKYGIPIKAYHPDQEALGQFIWEKGPNAFYESISNRKACCHIRKVVPLQKALKGMAVWITGLRAEHSLQRKDLQPLEWDPANQLIKFHPLLHWTTDETRAFINENHIPYNPLHDRGFVSIGCAPCTRAVSEGEDFRAGRWWWEDNNGKECGLHEKNNKTVQPN